MVWSTCIITKPTLIMLGSIRVALDCVREGEIHHEHHDRAIYRRLDVIEALARDGKMYLIQPVKH